MTNRWKSLIVVLLIAAVLPRVLSAIWPWIQMSLVRPDSDATSIAIMRGIGGSIHLLFAFIAQIPLAMWVYRDGKERYPHPVLWAILVGFTHLYALLIYFAVELIENQKALLKAQKTTES